MTISTSRSNGILTEPTPDGGVADRCDKPRLTGIFSYFCGAPSGQKHSHSGRQLASDGFNLDDRFWGGNPGAPRAWPLLEPTQALLEKPLTPHAHDFVPSIEPLRNFVVTITLSLLPSVREPDKALPYLDSCISRRGRSVATHARNISSPVSTWRKGPHAHLEQHVLFIITRPTPGSPQQSSFVNNAG